MIFDKELLEIFKFKIQKENTNDELRKIHLDNKIAKILKIKGMLK